MSSVLLVCMPFQVLGLSSLSTALLGAVLRRDGLPADEIYLHFELANIIGRDCYLEIAERSAHSLIGELLFAEGLHGGVKKNHENELELTRLFGDAARRSEILERFREVCLERIAAAPAELVGFTTSAQQLMPSLWLAREIKRHWPQVRVVLGGSSCSDPMGRRIFEAYPDEVDYLVSGFGETPLLDLASGRISDARKFIRNYTQVDLNSLPLPDYRSYKLQASELITGNPGDLMLAFESSRGCWWGQKNHCSFCGLNQSEVSYHCKSSERVVEEVRSLWESYGFNLFATDTILSHTHLREALPQLASFEEKPNVFFEVKPNMRRSDIQLLRQAAVTWVQPGVESLSTPLLKLLNKGVTAIQNLAFLKWCREESILVSWNLLCGIPDEQLQHYQDQLQLMPRIPHLPPPGGVSPIRVDRYSPYFNDYSQYGWSELRPMDIYPSLHPQLPAEDLHEIAYHFEGVGGPGQVHEYFPQLDSAIKYWQRRHSAGEGLFWDQRHGLVRIEDGATMAYGRDPALEAVISATHDIIGVDKLLETKEIGEDSLDELIQEGILFREGRRVVNLAVRLPDEVFRSSAKQ